MATMMQAVVRNAVLANCQSINFDIRLRHIVDAIAFSPRYLVKVTEVLLETDGFLKPGTRVFKTEVYSVVEAGSKSGKRIKRFIRADEKTVSVYSSSSIGPCQRTSPMIEQTTRHIPSQIPTKRVVNEGKKKTDFAGVKQTWIEKLKSDYKSGRVNTLKVIRR